MHCMHVQLLCLLVTSLYPCIHAYHCSHMQDSQKVRLHSGLQFALQIASAEQYAQAGDVILSPEVAGVTRGLCSLDPLEGNNARLVSMSDSLAVSFIHTSTSQIEAWLTSLVTSNVRRNSMT